MIKGKVYDVTGWGADHPGGEVLYTYGGQVRSGPWVKPPDFLSSVPVL